MSTIPTKLTLEHRSILLLWQRVNTSLSAFYKLKNYFGSAKMALNSSIEDWVQLGIHAKHIKRHQESNEQTDSAFVAEIESCIAENKFHVLFQGDPHYPQQLLTLFDPPPLLFYRGNCRCLSAPQVAIVGSRKPSQKAQKFTFDMAQYLAQAGFIITSGLAQGVDAQAHLGALSQPIEYSGRTIGVMGTGIDVCYPRQHQALFDRIIAEGGCIISELLPSTQPHKHTFPRRNRLVAGLSLGTVVTEATMKSGSLITARLTSEQGKQVFALPSTIDNINAQGCHELIREGATLVYHPDQVINDLSSQLTAPIQTQPVIGLESENLGNVSNVDNINVSTNPKSKLNPSPIMSNDTSSLLGSSASELAINNDNTTLLNADNLRLDSSISTFSNGDQPVSLPKTKTNLTVPKTIKVPQHLQELWVHLEFEAQDLDALIAKTKLDTPALLSQLMELELIGALSQVAGRYQRV